MINWEQHLFCWLENTFGAEDAKGERGRSVINGLFLEEKSHLEHRNMKKRVHLLFVFKIKFMLFN